MRIDKGYKTASFTFLVIFILITAAFALHVLGILKFHADKSALNLNIVVLYALFALIIVFSYFVIIHKISSLKFKEIENKKILIEETKEKKNTELKEQQKEQQKIENEIKLNETVAEILRNISNVNMAAEFSDKLLSNISKKLNIVQGVIFLRDKDNKFKMNGTYAYYSEEDVRDFVEGEGISGQVAKNKRILNISNIPPNYVTILSGLGNGSPNHLIIFPLLIENNVIGICELASFEKFDRNAELLIEKLSVEIGKYIEKYL